MLRVTRDDVVADPFPHIVKQDILPDDLFAELRADFPEASIFESQLAESGTANSRTGSGFDIYRGDAAFDTLTARSPAWARFHGYVNSEAFVEQFRDVFADHIDGMGLRIDVGASHVIPSYVEPRATMTERATLGDRVQVAANKLLAPLRAPPSTDLFTRLDIHKSLGGYYKPPHTDRPNRLCSLIVYFSDAEAIGLEGGDLGIFRHKQVKPITRYERHPRPDAVERVATLSPRANLGVFFPCSNNSYHGVSAVTSTGIARDFLYINVSGRSASLW